MDQREEATSRSGPKKQEEEEPKAYKGRQRTQRRGETRKRTSGGTQTELP